MNPSHSSGPVLRDYLRILRRGALIVIATTVIVTGSRSHPREPGEALRGVGGRVPGRGQEPALEHRGPAGSTHVDPERAGKTQASLARVPAVARRALKEAGVGTGRPTTLLGSSTVGTHARRRHPDVHGHRHRSGRGQPARHRLRQRLHELPARDRHRLDRKGPRQIEGGSRRSRRDRNTRYRSTGAGEERQELRTVEALQGSNAGWSGRARGAGANPAEAHPERDARPDAGARASASGLAFLRDALEHPCALGRGGAGGLGLPLLGRIPQLPKGLVREDGVVMLGAPDAPETEAYPDTGHQPRIREPRPRREDDHGHERNPRRGQVHHGRQHRRRARPGRQQVILVDLDLKRPSLDRLFGLRGEGARAHAGGARAMRLNDALVRIPIVRETTRPTATSSRRAAGALGVLQTGPMPPNTADFVASSKLGRGARRAGRDARPRAHRRAADPAGERCHGADGEGRRGGGGHPHLGDPPAGAERAAPSARRRAGREARLRAHRRAAGGGLRLRIRLRLRGGAHATAAAARCREPCREERIGQGASESALGRPMLSRPAATSACSPVRSSATRRGVPAPAGLADAPLLLAADVAGRRCLRRQRAALRKQGSSGPLRAREEACFLPGCRSIWGPSSSGSTTATRSEPTIRPPTTCCGCSCSSRSASS